MCMLHLLISALILVSNLYIYDSLLYEQDSLKIARYPLLADIITYFYLDYTNSGSLKYGVVVYLIDNIFKVEKQTLWFCCC